MQAAVSGHLAGVGYLGPVLLVVAVADAKDEGRLSADLGATTAIGAALERLLEGIEALPAECPHALLGLCRTSRRLGRGRVISRPVWRWAESLRADGVLSTGPEVRAERSEHWLLDTLLDDVAAGAHRTPGRVNRES